MDAACPISIQAALSTASCTQPPVARHPNQTISQEGTETIAFALMPVAGVVVLTLARAREWFQYRHPPGETDFSM